MATEILAGTGSGSINPISPAWPSHQADDIGVLLIASTQAGVGLTTASGFELITGGSVASGTTTTLTSYIARATSGAMTAPTTVDPTNHAYGVIIRIRGLDPLSALADLIDVVATSTKAVASTSASSPTVTTTQANSLVFSIITRDDDLAGASFSSWANANLTDTAPVFDDGTASGNGGGIGVWVGTKASAGATGVTAASVANSVNVSLTLAIKVPAAGSTTRGKAFGNRGTAFNGGRTFGGMLSVGDIGISMEAITQRGLDQWRRPQSSLR